jgi:hypothetical protein
MTVMLHRLLRPLSSFYTPPPPPDVVWQLAIGGTDSPFGLDAAAQPEAQTVAASQSSFQQAIAALCRLKDRFASTATAPQWAHAASLLLHRHSLAASSRALGGMSGVAGLQLLADSVSPPRMFSSPSDGSFSIRPLPRPSQHGASSPMFAAVAIDPSSSSSFSMAATLPSIANTGGTSSLPDGGAGNGASNAPFDEAHFDALVAHVKQLAHFRQFTAALQLLQVCISSVCHHPT